MTAPTAAAASPVVALHPDHVADLRRSGLTDEMIDAAGIRSLAPSELVRTLGSGLASRAVSAYLIPYPEADGFARVKLFPPVATADGGTMRYFQPAGSVPRLYLPPRARAALAEPSVSMFWTEGEKKALAGDQACIGLGGLWNWLDDGRPIPDLDRIDHVGRVEVLVPDSDVWTRPDLLQPVYALMKELEERGATVSVVKLPAGPAGAKSGLDDYLVSYAVADIKGLPTLTVKSPALARLAAWWKGWHVKREAGNGAAADAMALLERGETVRTLHPAQDVLDGTLWYGVPSGEALILVNSDRAALDARALPRGIAVRHTALRESSVSREAALAWLGGATGSVAGALDAVAAFVQGYIAFPDRRTPVLLAAWALGTWTYRAFRIYPYLSIRSPEKRCGKTRLLAVLRLIAFNAAPITAVPTEAQLFRGAATSGGAQLFDEVEGLQGDRERFEALISVLNVGFERGGVVSRLEKRGDRFEEQRYEVYAPRALAGIGRLSETLADRAIPVFMTRKRRDERVARLTGAVEPEAAALRDRCALACLPRIGAVLAAAADAPSLLEREDVDDRAVDLWTPLVALAVAADGEDGGARTRVLLDLARETGGLRDADQADGQTGRLVEALMAIRAEHGEALAPEALRAALAVLPGFDWVTNPRRLAGLLNPLGFVRERHREGTRLRWLYRLDLTRLADLAARYGPAGESADPAGASEKDPS
jgi:hypothetical protein